MRHKPHYISYKTTIIKWVLSRLNVEFFLAVHICPEKQTYYMSLCKMAYFPLQFPASSQFSDVVDYSDGFH